MTGFVYLQIGTTGTQCAWYWECWYCLLTVSIFLFVFKQPKKRESQNCFKKNIILENLKKNVIVYFLNLILENQLAPSVRNWFKNLFTFSINTVTNIFCNTLMYYFM